MSFKALNLLKAEANGTSAESMTYPMIGVGPGVGKQKWCPVADRHCLKEECAWWEKIMGKCSQVVLPYLAAHAKRLEESRE